MDVDRLQAIIDWMRKSPVEELEVADGDFRVRLVRKPDGTIGSPAPSATSAPAFGEEVTAPSYGIVHLASTPGAAPFVTLGSTVSAGQTLCVIEAMKVFTPIEAVRGGTVTAILVEDGAEVSAGLPLFRLD